jgi:hypothetical protein
LTRRLISKNNVLYKYLMYVLNDKYCKIIQKVNLIISGLAIRKMGPPVEAVFEATPRGVIRWIMGTGL